MKLSIQRNIAYQETIQTIQECKFAQTVIFMHIVCFTKHLHYYLHIATFDEMIKTSQSFKPKINSSGYLAFFKCLFNKWCKVSYGVTLASTQR